MYSSSYSHTSKHLNANSKCHTSEYVYTISRLHSSLHMYTISQFNSMCPQDNLAIICRTHCLFTIEFVVVFDIIQTIDSFAYALNSPDDQRGDYCFGSNFQLIYTKCLNIHNTNFRYTFASLQLYSNQYCCCFL